MVSDLFAGIAVSDYPIALRWYEQLLGSAPSFLPNQIEAVWEVTEHGYVYIEVRPGSAGHAKHTIFVDDLDAVIAQISARGLEPGNRETYDNGARKATYFDPDGNEIGFGGAPTESEPKSPS